MGELLTDEEQELVALLGQCAGKFGRVIGDGRSRTGDLTEFVHHIHACQQQVLSQAAARAFPDLYRLLGDEVFGEEIKPMTPVLPGSERRG